MKKSSLLSNTSILAVKAAITPVEAPPDPRKNNKIMKLQGRRR